MRLLIAILIWLAAIAGAAELSSVVAASIHKSSASGGSGTSTTSGPGSGGGGGGGGGGGSGDASAVTATAAASLFKTSNFSKVLANARSAVGPSAQLDNFVIYPGYLSLTAIKGANDVDYYASTFGVDNTSTSPATPTSGPLPRLSQIKPGDPAALAARIAAVGHTPESQLHYMVVMSDPISGKFSWLVYTVTGSAVEYFRAVGGIRGPLFEYRSGSSSGLQRIG